MPYESMTGSDLFRCQKCGKCCQGYGGTFLTDKDIQSISQFIRTDPSDFMEKYCRMSGNKPILAQDSKGYCIFWKRHCTIHPVKPRMCREWPFIESVLIDVTNWRIMSVFCKGINRNVPDHIIKKCVEEERLKESSVP